MGTVRSGAVTNDGPSVPAGVRRRFARGAVNAPSCAARPPTRSRHPPPPGRSPCRPRSGRRTTRPAPAARAIARSAGESPTTATRGGSVCSAWHRAKTGSGSGFIGNPSSPQTMAPTASRTPRARSVASVGARSSVVTTAIRRPASRNAPKRAGRSARGLARATGSGTNHAVSVARRAAATLGHQRRSTVATTPSIWAIVAAASGPPAATRPVEGSKPMAANTSGATGRRAAASRRVPSSRAQPPHIAWKSMSVPSLSKITRSIPARSTGEPPVTTASPPQPPGRRSGPGRRHARGPGRPPVGTRARSANRLQARRGSGC